MIFQFPLSRGSVSPVAGEAFQHFLALCQVALSLTVLILRFPFLFSSHDLTGIHVLSRRLLGIETFVYFLFFIFGGDLFWAHTTCGCVRLCFKLLPERRPPLPSSFLPYVSSL